MEYLYNVYSSFLNIESNGINSVFQGILYHASFFTSYLIGRYSLQNVILKNSGVQKETISRICSSISQFYIIQQLLMFGCERSIHAFLSYLMNDMFFSFIFQEPLQKMIYAHHAVSVVISLVGLHIFYREPTDSFHYKNNFVISASLLGMEISAPLLSMLWIIKKESCFERYKKILLVFVYPTLFVSYIIFRLILPQVIFFYLCIIPWYKEIFFYSLVQICVLGLSLMQVFWFLKFFK